MYAKYGGNHLLTKSGKLLKQHHHVSLDQEFRNDCKVWYTFLMHQNTVNRLFIDLDKWVSVNTLRFYTDASFGCVFGNSWTFGQWEQGFIREKDPSIAYLELYALCMGIMVWANKLVNTRIVIFCDNQSVISMVNEMTSKCKNCMYLLHMLTLNNMEFNQ